MSVLIKGMEMPKRKNSIIFETRNGILMCRNLDVLDDDWYEVIEVPTPHGRLIDADELEVDTEWSDYYDGYQSYSAMQIKYAPTVIESED